MRKIIYSFLIISAVAIFVISCRKDPKIGVKESEYNPTFLDPKTIFPARFGMPKLPADNKLTVEGVYLGRLLFYDPVLSIDSTVSCASCHDQKHAFADPNKFSTGVFGLKTGRNAPPLFNMAYSHNFFWDARHHTLREQVLEPIQAHNEMAMTLPILAEKLKKIDRYKIWFKKAFNSEPDIFKMALAMEQFQLTLVSYQSRFNDFFPGKFSFLNAEETQGALLFNRLFEPPNIAGGDCFHCHGGQLIQANADNGGGLANNGLDEVLTDFGLGKITGKSTDNGVFKTSSLLNIAVTGPYMHDGRFKTLEEVIDHYSDSVKFNSPNLHPSMKAHQPFHPNFTPQQKAQLKAILLTMTDTAFLNNKAFSNPYK